MRENRLQVLHVVPCLHSTVGGPARSVPALCRALSRGGINVRLYTFQGGQVESGASSSEESIPIERFRPFPGSRQFPTLTFYRRIRQDLERCDLVHLHSLWNPVVSLAAFTCRQAGVPYVVSCRGMLQQGAVDRKEWRKRIYYSLWEERTLAGAAAIHFFTAAELRDSRHFLKDPNRFFVVPNGIDPSLAKNVVKGRFREAFPDLKGKQIMLFLGRLHPVKGLELQAEVLALLVQQFPSLVWVLVGPDDGDWPRLSRCISSLGLERHVLWTGPLHGSRCLEALADADVFLLTSRHEAHSQAMNEALASGVPLVITDTVQYDEIEEWGAGYVTSRKAPQVAAALANILAHPQKAREMADAGRRLAAERLEWSRVADAMVQVYEKVLAGPV